MPVRELRFVRSLNPPHLPESDANAVPVRGDYAAGGRGGEENPRRAKSEEGFCRVLPALLTATEHPCSVPQYTLPRSATMPMGRDPLTSRAAANSSIPLVTAKRSFLRGAGSGALPALIRNFAFLPIQNGRPMVSYRGLLVLVLLLFVGAAVRRTQPVSAGDEWQPISQEELKMTSVPEAPGALAVYLYRQVDRDDSNHTPHEYNYARIKILTEEGRKYADVEIPFLRKKETSTALRPEQSRRMARL